MRVVQAPRRFPVIGGNARMNAPLFLAPDTPAGGVPVLHPIPRLGRKGITGARKCGLPLMGPGIFLPAQPINMLQTLNKIYFLNKPLDMPHYADVR
jgi:hypothetical protein